MSHIPFNDEILSKEAQRGYICIMSDDDNGEIVITLDGHYTIDDLKKIIAAMEGK